MRLIPLALVALILFISVPSFAQEWIEYSNQPDFFSINLPGQPNVKDITYNTQYGITLPGRVYTAEDAPSRYSVTVIDFTSAKEKHAERVKTCKASGGDGDQCNERSAIELRGAPLFAAWNLMEQAAKVTHLVYAQADLVEGQEVHLLNADGSRTYAAIYMHEDRLYILAGTVPGDYPPPLLFQQGMRFLDKDGKTIRYVSTYTNGFPAPRRAR
jgi:hypothetical protein